MTRPDESVTETISGLRLAVVVVLAELAGVAGAMSMPMTSLPLGAVKRVGSILKVTEETWPTLVTAPGMMANVSPWPALRTRRSSRTSGAAHTRRRTRRIGFDGIMGPPWQATG